MIYLHWVPSRQTVNKEFYVEVLRQFSKRFRRNRPAHFTSGRWHFHQDIAPVHNSILVSNYLTKMGIKTVPHPPYSPDLTPCDFWLFPKVKKNLRGSRFKTIEEMKEAVTRVVDAFTAGTSKWPFRSWWNGTRSALQPQESTLKETRVECVSNEKKKNIAIRKKSGNLLKAPCICCSRQVFTKQQNLDQSKFVQGFTVHQQYFSYPVSNGDSSQIHFS